jgi:hypothetical protein
MAASKIQFESLELPVLYPVLHCGAWLMAASQIQFDLELSVLHPVPH